MAWAAEVAIPIDLEPGISPERLAPLVAGKRFVFLGEPDHFIREKYAFRLGFLRALHALGWRHLGMEMGRSDGLRLDRYLEGGDERDLLGVGLYSSASSVAATIESGGFFGQEISYALALRALAGGPERIRYFGFDLDMIPGNGIDDARSRLAGAPGEADLALVLQDAWSADDRIAELSRLLDEVLDPDAPWAADLLAGNRRELGLDLDALVESLRFQRSSAVEGGGAQALLEAFARRERAMFRLFDACLESSPAEARFVLTGHNMHLGRSFEGARWREIGSTFPVALWPSIGAHVTQRFPEGVYAIWLVYDHGEHLPSSSTVEARAVASVPGTVESLLARVPYPVFLLPLSSDDPRLAWLNGERTFRVNGGVGWGLLRDLTDALLFVSDVHAP